MAETSERSHESANNSEIPQLSDSRDISNGNLFQGNTVTTFSSLLNELMAKFSSTLKNQRHLQLLFLITFVLILLLMQVCFFHFFFSFSGNQSNLQMPSSENDSGS